MKHVSIFLFLLSAGLKARECALGIVGCYSVRTVCESCLWPAVVYVFPQKPTSLFTVVFQETIRVNVMMLKTNGEFHKGQVCLFFLFIQWINMQWNKVCLWMQIYCFVWCHSVWSAFFCEQNCSIWPGTIHSFCLSFFQVVFNITYVNGQVYLNDFPMKSGVAHITCQTVICEYYLFNFFLFPWGIWLPYYLVTKAYSDYMFSYSANLSIVEANHFPKEDNFATEVCGKSLTALFSSHIRILICKWSNLTSRLHPSFQKNVLHYKVDNVNRRMQLHPANRCVPSLAGIDPGRNSITKVWIAVRKIF